ncbi:tyrosine-type recombinase/integrase [Haloplanus salinarum]|uniref:tyrosine-type recombinase/integrase n=1 Tax=Haloplanus salinarum TaxID=1912324 RepID=UPI0031B81E74
MLSYRDESAEVIDDGWTYFGPHDLRRTWGTLLVEREVEPGLVMEWGGWEDWETFREHYLGAYSLDAQGRGREKVGWL